MAFASRFLRYDEKMMSGPDVLEVQEKLKELGYYQGSLDGTYSTSTELAVKTFQGKHNLKADGIVDPDTWNKLELYAPWNSGIIGEQSFHSLPGIIIDIDRRILLFMSDNFVKTYPVAVGKKTTPTPLGNWVITGKAVNPGGPFGVRWMRLSVPWGGYGIHGTNNPKSIGKAVSHGCIRMYNQDVIEIYDLAPSGTIVTIIGKAYANRILQLGDRGDDVREVQKMLRNLKYYRAKVDGYYGSFTRKAVIEFQQEEGLTQDGIVGPATLTALQKAYAIAQGNQEP